MNKKIALVTNALDYVGPPAVKALLKGGYDVIAQDPAFQDTNKEKEVVPAGRLGEPEEIGELVSYLANMQGSFHTGTIIKFAGGWPAAPKRPI